MVARSKAESAALLVVRNGGSVDGVYKFVTPVRFGLHVLGKRFKLASDICIGDPEIVGAKGSQRTDKRANLSIGKQ
jgi:hypothetical protein